MEKDYFEEMSAKELGYADEFVRIAVDAIWSVYRAQHDRISDTDEGMEHLRARQFVERAIYAAGTQIEDRKKTLPTEGEKNVG